MRKIIKALLTLVVISTAIVCTALFAVGCGGENNNGNNPNKPHNTTPSKGLAYTINPDGTTCTVTGMGTCTDSELVIPSKHEDGYEITAIGDEAFYYCYNILSVTIPNTVTSIGEGAFYDCFEITNATIGNNVVSIGNHAFSGCRRLTSITIPKSLTLIDKGAFAGCNKLVEIINNSSLNITKGSTDNGRIAYYALNVKKSGTSDIVNKNDYLFYTCDKTNYLIGYLGTETEITLPENYNGKNYKINRYAFESCGKILVVTIPDSITDIGDYAFSNCSNLMDITLPKKITSIKEGTFMGCSSLMSLTLPDSVTSIGQYAFLNCGWITDIKIGKNLSLIEDMAFYRCLFIDNIYISDISTWCNIQGLQNIMDCGSQNKKLYLNDQLIINLVIPDKVTAISDYAFFRYTGLKSVTVPDTVTSIGEYSFYDCIGLAEVVNNSSLYITKGDTDNGYIARYALNVEKNATCRLVNKNDYLFYTYGGTNYLLGYVGDDTDLILPENYNGENYKIHDYAFYDCKQLTNITIPDSVTSIGNSAFTDCVELVTLTMGNGVTSIGNSAFENCHKLTGITIPNSVTSIGNGAFKDCMEITSVAIPDGVISIGDNTFEDCRKLTSVTIPDTVTSIGNNAFKFCTELTDITIPDSITSIGDDAFEYCELEKIYITNISAWCKISGITNLMRRNSKNLKLYLNNEIITNLVIPDDVTVINDYAFANCIDIRNVIIHNNVTSIGQDAFYGCNGLTNVTIGCGVTNIGEYAFARCDNIEEVIWDTNIPVQGFYDSKIEKLTFGENVKIISRIFAGYGISSITISNGATEIDSMAFWDCKGLTSITIPDSVTTIKHRAFWECTALEEIHFNGTIEQWNAIKKYSSWNSQTGEYTVYCTDGNISKS